jgi:NAD-dependent SIR2 family protein deacetylase
MATRAETDLPPHVRSLRPGTDEDELAHLWGPTPRAGQRPQIDICPECQRKPVSEALAWFGQQMQSGGSQATLKASRPAKSRH